jgi:hypothetical protein
MPQSAPETLSWTFPGAPFRIQLHSGALSKLRVSIAEAETTEEIGGVLLGSADMPAARLDITDVILIRSVSASGRYKLDTSEVERLRNQTLHAGNDQQLPVVGYFRTQVHGALDLRETELELVKHYFGDPTDVVLLIQPARRTAGFFCWCGDFFTPVSLMDFAFEGSDPIPDAGHLHPVEELPRPPAPIVTPKQSYFSRVILATGLAVLAVAIMHGPVTSVPASNTHAPPTTQPAISNNISSNGEPRENTSNSSERLDRNPSPVPSTAGVPLPKHAGPANRRKYVKSSDLSKRSAWRPEPPKTAPVLPDPDLHHATLKPEVTPKAIYVWR